MKFPTYKHEQQKLLEGLTLIAGCDEVGIAPLAGPVVAAAVILNSDSIGAQRSKSKWWYRVRDSKTTSEKERAVLIEFILDNCLCSAVGIVDPKTIDRLNIYHASRLAMANAVKDLDSAPEFLFVDGLRPVKELDVAQQAIVKGDSKVLSIAAASILAKVTRDKILAELSQQYPQYGFDQHKGYPTLAHRNAILRHGVSPVHRRSFRFVQQCLGA